MKTNKWIFLGVAGGLITASSEVRAQDGIPNLLTDFGTAVSIGGGVQGFTDGQLTDITDPGGSWSARLTLGTRMHIGGELAYIGSAQDVTTAGLDDSAVLFSSGVEGLVRLNLTDEEPLQPFAFGGVGWRYYNVVGDDFNFSSVQNSDNVAEFPFGVGLAYRWEGFVADARFNIRPTVANDLVAPNGTDEAQLHSWGVNARIGWEF